MGSMMACNFGCLLWYQGMFGTYIALHEMSKELHSTAINISKQGLVGSEIVLIISKYQNIITTFHSKSSYLLSRKVCALLKPNYYVWMYCPGCGTH